MGKELTMIYPNKMPSVRMMLGSPLGKTVLAVMSKATNGDERAMTSHILKIKELEDMFVKAFLEAYKEALKIELEKKNQEKKTLGDFLGKSLNY
tara:strand:- start:1028 stop:1309 length:282 start_codon:yes stop_codon:yes gene_type:complete